LHAVKKVTDDMQQNEELFKNISEIEKSINNSQWISS
jgi:hypothetical protein